MASGSSREYIDVPQWFIVSDAYDEDHELELDKAIEAQYTTIIIEPQRLAEETSRWITMGNGLRKTGTVVGLASIGINCYSGSKLHFSLPLASLGFVCCGFYNISWGLDPCVHYQVERDPKQLSRLPLGDSNRHHSVVLVRRPYSTRRALHNVVTLVALTMVVWRAYQLCRRGQIS